MQHSDQELLRELERSECYGIAHDPVVSECGECALKQECSALTKSNSVFDDLKTLDPFVANLLKKRDVPFNNSNDIGSLTTRRKKPDYPSGMPNVQNLTLDELWELLKEHGGTCKVYEEERIQKMRLVMAIKDTFTSGQEETKKVVTKKKKKADNPLPEGTPNLKKMNVEELWSYLNERNGTCKVYDNEAIQKMHLVMAIKKTFESNDQSDVGTETIEKTNKAKKKKIQVEYSSDMPDMKKMENEELWKLLKERNGECKVFEHEGIQKMRLIMAIKKTYAM